MNKIIVTKLHNGLGNQMFIYASNYALSKKYKRKLLIDNETEFLKKKNINNYSNTSKYFLNCFSLSAKISPNKYKFIGKINYFRYKFLIFLNKFKLIKNYSFIKEKRDKNKISSFQRNMLKNINSNIVFLSGHFETEKYFINCKDEIKKEFSFKKEKFFKKNKLFHQINNSNSISICLRRHRFSEKARSISKKDISESLKFESEQIHYINQSLKLLKKRVRNYKIFLWSNDYEDIDKLFKDEKINIVKTNDVILDFFLMKSCKFFIVIPSTFNWWGAWLSNFKKKIIFRPSKSFFSNYQVNNKDYWPIDWIEVKKS